MPLVNIGDLITADGQLEFNGYLLGDNETTFLEQITGWDDLPGVTSGNTLRSGSHGAWVGRKLAGMRVITWSGRFSPPDPNSWATELKALRSAFTLPEGTEEMPIVIRSHDETLLAFGAVVNRSIPMNSSYGSYWANVSIQFECSDPRKYSLDEHVRTLEMPALVESGLIYPLTYPLDYGIEPNSASGTLTNSGDAKTPVTLTFNGPMVGPAVVSQTAGVRLEFDIALSESDFLTVDTRTGTVLLNGVADRLYTRTSASAPLMSFGLLKGDNNLLLTADSWGDGASLDITWRDATL